MTAIGCSFFLSALIYIPLMWKMFAFESNLHGALVLNFPLILLSDLLSLPIWPLGIVFMVLMMVGLVDKKFSYWRPYILFLFMVPLLVWLTKPWYLYSRFFAFLLPFIFLLIAHGIVIILKRFQGRFYVPAFLVMVSLLSFVVWSWATQPSTMVEDFKGKYREALEFAEQVSSANTSFCAFGSEDGFFQFYSHRHVETFGTYDDFQSFYQGQNSIVCFATMGPPMSADHKRILAFILNNNPKGKKFGDVWLFALK
jgi:hypothetical protein